ncbi:hypothetical protein, partial [Salmonella enterica]|uniref:hypothetical protein n=1 Tax=Salmonella enterica TaxID=28901 RepID=UPI003D28DBA0
DPPGDIHSNHARSFPASLSRALDECVWRSIGGAMDSPPDTAPRRHLGIAPATLIALGMVMSTDSLKTAPTVAANVAPGLFLWLWIGG